jgi:hypothetical protein
MAAWPDIYWSGLILFTQLRGPITERIALRGRSRRWVADTSVVGGA